MTTYYVEVFSSDILRMDDMAGASGMWTGHSYVYYFSNYWIALGFYRRVRDHAPKGIQKVKR